MGVFHPFLWESRNKCSEEVLVATDLLVETYVALVTHFGKRIVKSRDTQIRVVKLRVFVRLFHFLICTFLLQMYHHHHHHHHHHVQKGGLGVLPVP